MSRYTYQSTDFSIATSATEQLFGPNGGIKSADIQNYHATLDLALHFGNPWCLSFDGTNDLIDCDTAAVDLSTATQGSIEAGIFVTAAGSGARTLFSLSDADTETAMWIKIDTNNKVEAALVVGGTVQWSLLVSTALTDDIWYEVKLVQNGVSPVIYINGSAWVQAFTVTTDKTAWFGDLTGIDTCNIGSLDYNSAADADFFQGYVDYLKVVDGLGTHKSAGIKSLFVQLDEGTGTTATDDSSNANNGSISGATWTLRSAGVIHSADTGRIYHYLDDPDVRKGVWATNTDGSSAVTGSFKLAPNA